MAAAHGSALERMVWRVLLGLLIAYLIGFAVFVTELPGQAPPQVHADAVVALTGGEDRLDTAVALFEHGIGKRLLITGVYANMTKNRLQPMLHGGPRFDCCADLGFTATNTHGNAMETARWVKEHHFQSLIVVTANYHMPRSMTEFHVAMPGITLVPYPVPTIAASRRWWLDPVAVKTLQYEYAKYLGIVVLATVYPGHWKDSTVRAGTTSL